MKNILIVFSLFIHFVVASKPLPPTINYLSVDSITCQVEIYWTNNSSDVIGYIIYHYDLNGIWVSLDTVSGINNTYYKTFNSMGQYSSQKYSIVAFDSNNNNSPRSEPHSTIYAQANYSLCSRSCDITWNNYYMSNMAGYKLFVKALNSTSQQVFFDTIVNINNLDTSDYFSDFMYNNLEYNSKYFFTIAAYDENDSLSRSNVFSIETTEIEKPDFLYIRSVNNLDTVKINYHINNYSDITDIKVYKRNNYGSFYHHKTVPFDSSYLYIIDYNILDIGYYYYLSPVDKCGNDYTLPSVVMSSDTSIVNTLNIKYNDNLYFDWNNYEGFLGNVYSYNIYQELNGSYSDIQNVNSNYFPFEIQDYGVSCFYLYAIEDNNNIYSFRDTSFSNKICLEKPPLVFLPNTFSPNNDYKNDTFYPVIEGVYDVKDYVFNILDKWGNIIFTSNNNNIGWDGVILGRHAPIGNYFYNLHFNYSENNIYSIAGEFYLIR